MVPKGKRPLSQLFGSTLTGTKGLILWLDEGLLRGSIRGRNLARPQRSSTTPSALILWVDQMMRLWLMVASEVNNGRAAETALGDDRRIGRQ